MAMTRETRQELLQVLEALSAQCPEIRFGQLIANLATLARRPAVEALWDVEDAELLQAAQQQLAIFRARPAAVAS